VPRLERSLPKYALRQSPLFRLRSKRTLADVLGWSGTGNELDAFANRVDNYRLFTIEQDGNKTRDVQEPKAALQRIHRRIASLLLRIEVPDYLHSGLRGRSFVTNGMQHVNGMPAVKLDIRKFYPSTKWQHIYRCFLTQFECSADVSAVLASLSCVRTGENCHLPTGSAVSQIMAFYAHRRLFDSIDEIAQSRGGIFTLYVDDMVLSMPDASPADILKVGRLLEREGLEWHKDRFFPAGRPKRVTGTIAGRHRLEANKRLHFKYSNALSAMDCVSPMTGRASAARCALGLLQSIAQIDARHADRAHLMSQKLLPLTRQSV
jgi:hypothetical protein